MSTLPVGVSKCEKLFRRLEVGAQPRRLARAVHSLHPSDTAARQRGLRVMCDVPQSCPGRCSGRPACELLGGWPSSLLAEREQALQIIKDRWVYLHSPLHSVAYALNPRFVGMNHFDDGEVKDNFEAVLQEMLPCLLYTSPSPRD